MFERILTRGPRRFALCVASAVAGLLGGCVVAPAGPYAVGAPVAYPAAPVYAAPVYAPAPYYGYGYGWPAISIGLSGTFGHGYWGGRHGSGWGHGGWGHHGWGHRGWRR